ncbi:MAG: serine/threonine-protein kinase [Bryobacterales bacterium]|nr:serine/threonine-protein kinase [Bryobacterales bacterium]
MPLPGQRLGPYEIVACIGAGGMGEVYKARDTRLDRLVAIKVSKEDFTDRFEREARAVAALNHPNICQLYDVGPNYLVMEFIEGTPLVGPLPPEKAVEYAGQVLDALASAHARKITHRDLKPANILVTKQGIKLLDFGLAKQQSGAVGEADATITDLTVRGTILGTLQYMSPEQLQGKEADARSDLFSFGCVLYELLSGKRAFTGESAAAIIGAILHQQPEPIDAGPSLAAVIRRCLAKDPEERFQTARDLKYSVTMAAANEHAPLVASASRKRASWPYFAVATATLAFALVLWMVAKPSPLNEVIRFTIPMPDIDWRQTFSISPNGSQIAMVLATKDARRELFLRRLDSAEARLLPGTSGVEDVAWSPDSSEIAFVADGRLKRLSLFAGVIQDTAHSVKYRGFTWSPTGVFLVSPIEGGPLFSIPVSGGTPAAATVLDTAKNETGHQLSSLCPDGRHFLYRVFHQDGHSAMKVGLLGSPQHQMPLEAPVSSVCAGGPGWFTERTYLLHQHNGSLIAREFDPSTGKRGEQVSVLARSPGLMGASILFSTPPSQVIGYRATQFSAGKLTWHDRDGRVLGVLPDAAVGLAPTLSADGRYLATTKYSETRDEIWITDLSRNSSTPLLLGLESATTPVWSPDGSHMAFMSNRGLHEVEIAGGGASRLVAKMSPGWLQQYSPDGKHLLYVAASRNELKMVALAGEPNPVSVAPAGPTYYPATFSPDSRLITYTSAETGRVEVYVRAVPPATGKWLISNNGGGMSFWRQDGKELFFLSSDRKMMAVDVQLTPTFRWGTPRALFQTNVSGINNGRSNYVVSKDGQRFLILTPPEDVDTAINVIVNWHPLLRKPARTE